VGVCVCLGGVVGWWVGGLGGFLVCFGVWGGGVGYFSRVNSLFVISYSHLHGEFS